MLIANYSIINQICGHNHSGVTNPMQWLRPHVMRGYYSYSDVNPNKEQIRRDSFPTGTNPPACYILGDKGALLSSTNTTNGVGTLTGNAAMGRAIAAGLTGTGTITNANLSLIIQLACNTLTGSGTLTASMSGLVQLASSLAGSGSLTASLKLIAYITSTLTGSGSVSATLRGTASLEADITPFTTLSPENLAASVWNSLAASFNSAGTMGEKMNDAGSASNPWADTTDYGAGTKGQLLEDAANAASVWTEVIESGYTAAEILRLLAAANLGKTSGQPDSPVFRDIADTKDRITATVDINGNRNNIVLDES